MTRTKSKRDLPRELWQEILSRLPVRLILRFRCVSKSWRSMINDPDFCHLHFRHFSNNRQQTHLLFVAKDVEVEVALPSKSTNTFNLLTDSTFHQSYFTLPAPHNTRNWYPLSSIDGLVMLVGDERGVLYPSLAPKLLLWNPSIRKSRVLPTLPKLPRRMRYVDMGFGFDPLINDYKHVRVAYLNGGSPQFVAIYTVGLGSWKTIPFQSKGCLSCHFRYRTPCKSRGRLFSIAFNRGSRRDELVSFDLSNEVFTSTSLPEAGIGFSLKKHLTVVNGKCLFVQQTTLGGSVWTLESPEADSDSMYWTKRYSIITTNGTCTLLPSTQGWLETEDVLQNRLEERVIRNIIDSPFSIVRLFDYFESLVLLK